MGSLSVCSKEHKIMCLADDEKVDKAVYLWYIQKSSQEILITGPVLREKTQLQLHGNFMETTLCHLFKLALAGSGNFVNHMGLGSCFSKVKSFRLTYLK